jgi:hypothetical protein
MNDAEKGTGKIRSVIWQRFSENQVYTDPVS